MTNTAHAIHIDVEDAVIAQIRFDGDGERSVMLTGNDLIVRAPTSTHDASRDVTIPSTATAAATVNVNLRMQTHSFLLLYQLSTNVPFIIGPDGALLFTGSFFNTYGSGVVRVEGRFDSTIRNYLRNWELAPGPGVARSFNQISIRSLTSYRIEGDTGTGSRISTDSSRLELIRAVPGTVRFTCSRDIFSGLNPVMLMHAEDVGEGHLTLHVGGVNDPPLVTTTNTTVEFNRRSIGSDNDILWAESDAVSGSGSVRVNLDSATRVMTVARPLTHTGGTLISQGILRLTADGVNPPGTLPETGMMTLESDGTFHLNGHDDTIGGLGGVGVVRLGGSVLTLTEGIAPGMSVGTLTIRQSGGLVLDGDSAFEFADTETFDQVVFDDDADLTLGGTLVVHAPEDFAEYGSGRYRIVQMNGGSVNDAFAAVTPPRGMTAKIEISDGDVYLVLSSGTVILVR